MENKTNQFLFFCLLAFTIIFCFFLNLEWGTDNPINISETFDLYFGSDVSRVVNNLNDDGASHYRNKVHPYFSLVAVSVSKIPTYFGYKNLGFPVYKMVFGTLGTFLFWLFIYKNTSVLQSFASLSLILSTMSLHVWSVIPETFLFSFFTLMVAINLMELKIRTETILLATLAGTITNLFLGLAYLVLEHKKIKLIIRILVYFITVSVMISIIQRNIYPTSEYFFNLFSHGEELKFMFAETISIPFKLFDFLFSGFVVPLNNEISLPVTTWQLWNRFFSVEFFSSKKVMLFTALTLVSIGIMYVTSLFAFIKSKYKTTVSFSILIFISFELILHLVYGDSPFLYSLNFMPLIIIFISLHQPEKIKKVTPHIFVYLAFLVHKFNFSAPYLFEKYFS